MKKIITIFYILFYIVLAYGQFIDETRGEVIAFNSGGGKWTLPTGCTDGCKTVEWTPQEIGGEMFMKFTVTGSSYGYVAVALSADDTMGNDDAYICTKESTFSNDIKIQSAYLTGFTFPVINSEITNDPGSETNLTEDYLSCSFLRPYNVTKDVSGGQRTWSIENTNYYLLFAEGQVLYEGGLSYHIERSATPAAFSLLSNNDASGEFPLDTRSMVNLNLSRPVDPEDHIIATATGGSWLVPSDQCPRGGCKNIQWEQVTGPDRQPMMQFTILGNSQGWIGMAISSDETMGDDDCYYCARDSPDSSNVHITSAYLAGRARPVPVERVHHSRVYLASIENSLMICRFLRPINETKIINGSPVTWNLSQNRFNLFFAEGSVDNNGTVAYHSFRRRTNGPFYFLSNEGYATIDPFQYVENTTSTVASTTVMTNFYAEENVEMSPSGGGSWTFPTGCNDSSCRSLKWEPLIRNQEDSVKITISGVGQDYIGFLLTTELAAATGDCYFCMRNPANGSEVVVRSGFCSPNSPPTDLDMIPHEQIARAEATDSMLSCTFYRPLSVRKTLNEEVFFYDLSQTAYVVIYEEGNLISEEAIAPPHFGAFTPVPITLINKTLFRRSRDNMSILVPQPSPPTENNVDLETTTRGGSGSRPSDSRILIFLLNGVLFYMLYFTLC